MAIPFDVLSKIITYCVPSDYPNLIITSKDFYYATKEALSIIKYNGFLPIYHDMNRPNIYKGLDMDIMMEFYGMCPVCGTDFIPNDSSICNCFEEFIYNYVDSFIRCLCCGGKTYYKNIISYRNQFVYFCPDCVIVFRGCDVCSEIDGFIQLSKIYSKKGPTDCDWMSFDKGLLYYSEIKYGQLLDVNSFSIWHCERCKETCYLVPWI